MKDRYEQHKIGTKQIILSKHKRNVRTSWSQRTEMTEIKRVETVLRTEEQKEALRINKINQMLKAIGRMAKDEIRYFGHNWRKFIVGRDLEEPMRGGIEAFTDGGMESFSIGGMKSFRDDGMESFRDDGLESFRDGGMESFRNVGLAQVNYEGLAFVRC